MATRKPSFADLYRANQARAEQESPEQPDPSEATLTLSDLVELPQVYRGGH